MRRSANSLIGLIVVMGLLPAAALGRDDGPSSPRHRLAETVVFGGGSDPAAKAVVDTHLLLGPWGSGADHNGQFQTPGGAPAWNGWTSVDLTQPDSSRWHASTYHAVSGAYSAWCGDDYPSCGGSDPSDPPGGYGNNWDELLEWRGAVADNGLGCTVTVMATLQYDTEPGYDYCYLSYEKAAQGIVDVVAYDFGGVAAIAESFSYAPGDYLGPGADEVVVLFRFESDGGFSDEDCFFQTAGACQLDDVTITLSNGVGYATGFEDGTLGDFAPRLPQGVGDFASLRSGLDTPFPCPQFNLSPMVTFIDDGVVVPGTGGSQCESWCYGPGGWVVNHTGGLAGPDAHIDNAVVSPVMAWPGPGYEGATLEFDVWRHNPFSIQNTGVFFYWGVRSTTDPDPATLAYSGWVSDGFFITEGPDWLRAHEPVSDLIPADAEWVQVRLVVTEIGFIWGLNGTDGTPAPYFDNVRLAAFPPYGPRLSAVVTELPQDAFPEGGDLDLVNLGANHARFDSGDYDTEFEPTSSTPGDSVVVEAVAVRAGAALVGPPNMHYRLQRNPLFDPYRTSGLPDVGAIAGWPATNPNAFDNPDEFAFDLPDTGFLFPGDVLHYCFAATDEVGGVPQTVTLPADTSGFADFSDPLAYPSAYTLRVLPTLTEDPGAPGTYVQPTVLFWDDAGGEHHREEWFQAFRNLGLAAGVDYDVYTTNFEAFFGSRGSGQGLGGRAAAAQLAGYEDLLYASDKTTRNTLGDGTSNNDTSLDVQLLDAWLTSGGKDLFLTGDDLAGDLNRTSGDTYAFLRDWVGVDLVEDDVLGMIGGQTSPLVAALPANPVLATVGSWRGRAECARLDAGIGVRYLPPHYDGVVPRVGAVRLAEFTDPGGATGAYAYSAATLNVRADVGSRVISLPYALRSVWTDGDEGPAGGLAARARLLGDVLTYFGQPLGVPSPVPDAAVFAASNHPNPFNPATTIVYNLPRAGRLAIEVFDLRGRHVRTLLDGPAPAGPGEATWDGRDEGGQLAAAGVYFYTARTEDATITRKMALIK